MSARKITIVKDEIHQIDLEYLKDFYQHCPTLLYTFSSSPGESEYKLYAYLGGFIKDTVILEVGTGEGGSALAFSHNPDNQIISYDIRRNAAHDHLKKDNVELRLGDFMEDDTIDYSKIDIILIDVDPHDGIKEPPMFKFLEEKNWSGLLLLDDISEIEWKAMHDMWLSLPYEKYDVTDIGHWSGTGLIVFGNKFEIEIK